MWPILMTACALVGAGYLSMYRLSQVEARVERVESAVAGKAGADEMSSVQRALGAVQLDIALICADTVRARGGNPMAECRTMGGQR